MTNMSRILGILGATAGLLHIPAALGASSAESAPPQNRAETLQEIVVTASYKEESNDSMKMGIPARDTPFSVESYTNSFMKSIETTQIADLYRYMTGLQKAGLTGYDLTVRGFSTSDSDRNTFLTDGLPGLSVRFGSPPTIGIEHIELVKGAASLLYGQAQPGGFVNIITKKPQETRLTQIETRGTINASSYSRVRGGDISFDSTGSLDGSDRVLYRLVGQINDDNHFRNLSYERDQYIAPSVTVKLGASTTLTAQFEYRSVRADYENVALLAPYTKVAATVAQLAPIQIDYTAPGTSRDERGTTSSAFLRHELADGGSLNVSVRSVDHHDYADAFDITGFDKTDPQFQTLDLRARGQSNQRTYNFADVNAVLPFATGNVGNRVIVGVDAGKEIDDFRRTKFCAINSPSKPAANPSCNIGTNQYTVSVLNPDFSAIPPPRAFGAGSLAENYIVSQTTAAYVSDLLSFGTQWKVLAGLRYSSDRLSAYVNRYDPTQPKYEQTSSTTLPQVGLIYQPDRHWSYYASYSTSYTPVDPSTQALVTSPLFKPIKGQGGEVGAKANFLGGRVNLTGAVFSIKETNVLTPYDGGTDAQCPTGGCSVQVGAARSKGAELELDAKPTPELTLIGGYAYTDARVSESTATGPLVGNLLPNSPFNALHFWSRYDYLQGPLKGLGAGLGYSYVSSRVANTSTAALPGEFELPSYQIVDLGVYKTFENGFNVTVKINNLFDRRYYQDGKITSGMVNVDAGAPRTVELYLTATF